MEHQIATRLIGFRSTELRVRVDERRDGYVFITTDDPLDRGTELVLRPDQVVPLREARLYSTRNRVGILMLEDHR